LALAAFSRRDFAKATKLGETSARLFSNNPIRRSNVALFAMYSGDFLAAQRHAQQAMSLRPSYEKGAMTWALSSAAAGAYDEARAGYERIYALSSLGRFFSTAGLADLALLSGRPADAVLALGRAMAAEASSDESRARLTATLAEARMAQGRAADGAELAIAAAQLSDSPAVRYLALSVLLAAGRQPEAARIAALPLPASPETRMMLKLMDGEVQLAKGNPTEALSRFREAVTVTDSWLARLALGRAYLATGALADAQVEFDQCLKRRGEATAVFLDDIPTLRMLAPVYYYQGVARSALKLSSAAESFRTFLAFKEGGDERSPLIDDARRRLREDR
jgi:tetratricopeptide (TPR) repeat protein